ncbi:MAG: hypothetical protein ACLGIR_07450 [Actinomycetes bacterium]|jgi:hypothetical protein
MTSAATSRTTATVLAILTSLLLLATLASPALAAHNGNNRADLASQTSDATGRAVVNYSEGQGTFNGTVTVRGLEAGTYTFRVTLRGGNITPVCELVAGGNGAAGCSAQDLDLPGFNTAEIVDAGGNVVARGVFDRAGNCRDPQQGGSLCESPALNPRP